GGTDAQAVVGGDPGHVRPEAGEFALDVGDRAADGRRDLQHRLHQLRVDPPLELMARDGREHGVDVLDEIERLRVEEHVRLLDPEGVGVAFAEGRVEHAPAGGEALAGDARGRELCHSTNASASISTCQRGSISCVITNVQAGLASPKTAPWARATSSKMP